jgi:hypothetical protein
MTSLKLKAAVFVLLCASSFAQVALSPSPHPIYFGSNGLPLSSGFLYSYAAGTTTRLDTYTDSTGSVANTWPIPLDATGAPSSGSSQTQIWLSNSAYKFCAFDSNLVQQWCADNISSYLGFLQLANNWLNPQEMPALFLTQVDNQIVTGFGAATQTVLDFPPSIAGAVLHFPNTTDTIVGRNTTDTLTNKTLTQPTIDGVQIINSPGTYIGVPNANPSGTAFNDLVSLAGGFVTLTLAGANSGSIGICVSNCGITGNAVIQTSGAAFCNFDGAATAGDYVQISQTINGTCHDAGTIRPNGAEVIGFVQQSLGGLGATTVALFPSPNSNGAICSLPPATVNNVGNVSTVINSCAISFSPGVLNVIGKTIRITGAISTFPSASLTNTIQLNLNGTAMNIAGGTSAVSVNLAFVTTCTVTATGVAGTMACTNINTPVCDFTQSGTVANRDGQFDCWILGFFCVPVWGRRR